MQPLSANRIDVAAVIARATVGAVPFIGSLLAEVVDQIIPHQRLDRLADFARALGERLALVEEGRVRERLSSEEGV